MIRTFTFAFMLLLLPSSLLIVSDDVNGEETPFYLSCQTDNDLYRVMAANGLKTFRYDAPAMAIQAAPEGAGVLLLADGYPKTPTVIAPDLFEQAAKKKLRLYVEFPAALPGIDTGPARKTKLERAIVSSNVFGEKLKALHIVAIHDCHFVPMTAEKPHLVIAKVAGFDRATFGIDDVETRPILFEHPNNCMLVSTTKLSQFVTARYASNQAMQAIWKMILGWVRPDLSPVELEWTPTVRATYTPNENLPTDAVPLAIARGMDWHTRAKMLIEEGRLGIKEGIMSRVHYDGTQPVHNGMRSDCNGESSLAFALRWKLDGDGRSRQVAANLLDWTYFRSGLLETDPARQNYGILYWTPTERQMLYHDNDVKAILGCLGTAGILESDQWNEVLVKNILGNFRTTGIHGFRGHDLKEKLLSAKGWKAYWNDDALHFHPHYECWIWATYLWLYDKTKFEPLLTRTRHAVKLTMEAYPDRWEWTNGIQQERGRMLLPLAWLVRVDDRPEHRRWLKQIADDLEKCQVACGAIREELGTPGLGNCPPAPSNDKYGTAEASLIQQNGDPLADMLYTCNFAFLGLHEAYAVTHDPRYARIADRLADFLLRVQIKSETHPELDGGWFRSFDYDKWEYWGSNADAGWGAWCIEVGWSQGWIPTVFMMRELKTSLWDLGRSSQVNGRFDAIRREMLPDSVLDATDMKIWTENEK